MATPSRIAAASLLVLVALAGAQAAPKVVWEPVAPAELSAPPAPLDPDAPAEAIFRKISIDDRDYPSVRRVREYVRYRIFDPEKATNVTRISQMTGSYDGQALQGNVEIHARLLLPDGTVQEFGNESVHERPLVHNGAEQSWVQRLMGNEGLDLKEKFLAVSGIVAGAILEFQVSHNQNNPPDTVDQSLQLTDIPIRHEEFVHQVSQSDDYGSHPFALNAATNQAQYHLDEKSHTVSVIANDLAALVREPFSEAQADYALTYLCAYRPRHTAVLTHHNVGNYVQVDSRKSGPWAAYATKIYFLESDGAYPTSRVKKLAAELTEGAASGVEKARALHRFVVELHLRYLAQPRNALVHPTMNNLIRSIDQVIDCEKHPELLILPEDFVWLAVALDRGAGLDAHTVMLPNRKLALFDPRQVAEMFLPVLGVRVLVDGQWQLSDPESTARIPFGLLPWPSEGQVGLVAQSAKQEFFDVPNTSADRSVIRNTGDFTLADDGTLTGKCRRLYTGQSALVQRSRFLRADPAKEKSILRRELAAEFKAATIKVTGLTGADDADAPLEVSYQMRYPDFATMTKDRIIFRPSVFHAFSASPFTAEGRKYPLEFPYEWKERDEVTLHLPAGYALESLEKPVSSPGKALSYLSATSFTPATGVLRLQRDFTSTLTLVPAGTYGRLKTWYDSVAVSDQHELALKRTSAAPKAEPAAPEAETAPTGL